MMLVKKQIDLYQMMQSIDSAINDQTDSAERR